MLKSFSKVVVAGPFKSEAEMAKKLGVSQQYVNRKIRKHDRVFSLDGKKIIAIHEANFVACGTNIEATNKEDLALKLGVPPDAVEKVLRKKTSGVVKTPKGEVKIQRLKPGEKPILPAVRVLWNDDTEKQDFFSFAAAAKELKIDPKTIPTALKAGRDSFTRKSDGKKFTIEIPGETTRLKPKPLSEETKAKRAESARRRKIVDEFRLHFPWEQEDSIDEMEKMLNQRLEKKASLEAKKESESPEKLAETHQETHQETLGPKAPLEETHGEEEEEIKEEDCVYLGMGLWEKKKPKEECETDPFDDEIIEKLFPTLGVPDILFEKQKKKLLRPGEVVLTDPEIEKVSRVLVVDSDFRLLEIYLLDEFEDNFYLSGNYPRNCVNLKEFADVGILPLGKSCTKEMIWRIKVCEKRNKN